MQTEEARLRREKINSGTVTSTNVKFWDESQISEKRPVTERKGGFKYEDVPHVSGRDHGDYDRLAEFPTNLQVWFNFYYSDDVDEAFCL